MWVGKTIISTIMKGNVSKIDHKIDDFAEIAYKGVPFCNKLTIRVSTFPFSVRTPLSVSLPNTTTSGVNQYTPAIKYILEHLIVNQ